jgi:membrane protease YdiL (CAAX protease family)
MTPAFVGQGAVWSLAPRIGKVPAGLLSVFIAVVLGWVSYALYLRWIEHRKPTELRGPGALAELAGGLAIGALIFGVCMGVLALVGVYRVTGVRDFSAATIPFLVAIASGVIEEIVFRGVIFRLVEDTLGTWYALLISSALFGLGHLLSPNATLLAALAIVFEAGIMLAAAYLLTRRLWLAIGIHAAWNFTQSGVFSVPTSGIPMHGWIDGTLTGPTWLTGGAFGVESSLEAVVLCTALGLTLLWLAKRRGHFKLPYWKRRATANSRATSGRAAVPSNP